MSRYRRLSEELTDEFGDDIKMVCSHVFYVCNLTACLYVRTLT